MAERKIFCCCCVFVFLKKTGGIYIYLTIDGRRRKWNKVFGEKGRRRKK